MKKNLSQRKLLPIADNLDFAVSEAYNLLRTNLTLRFPAAKGGKVVGVTSANAQDGKSNLSINTAYAVAKDGNRTLLVSADLRLPSIERILGINATAGLSDILAGNAEFDDCVIRGSLHENLSVLTAGTIPPMPSELLGSKQMEALISRLRTQYDYIILDLPPVLSVVDPIAVAKYTDGELIVIRHLRTKKQNVYRVIKQMQMANVNILGFVYNCSNAGRGFYKEKHGRNYGKHEYYYGGYGYGHNDGTASPDNRN